MTKIEKEVQLKVNYKITKWSNETLASVYCELKNISWLIEYSTILKKIKEWNEMITSFLCKALKTYNWKYKEFLIITEWHNLIPLAIRESFATLISWTNVTPTFKANYLALWTDATPVTENDTTLWNETIRWLFTDRSSVSNVAFLDKFFGSVEVWWTSFKEVWTFIDWTWTVDSWFLLSKINIEEDISATESLTINVSITIT